MKPVVFRFFPMTTAYNRRVMTQKVPCINNVSISRMPVHTLLIGCRYIVRNQYHTSIIYCLSTIPSVICLTVLIIDEHSPCSWRTAISHALCPPLSWRQGYVTWQWSFVLLGPERNPQTVWIYSECGRTVVNIVNGLQVISFSISVKTNEGPN